jgi:Xaa-Pro aminopeptidase
VTRTWCLGYAPDEVRQIYDTVMTAFDISIEAFGVGKPTHLMQEAVLDYFESQGHPTGRSKPGTTEGYVHSLGHGIGLKIHESPRITHLLKNDTFEVGNVVTIEPGLYYPDRKLGVRIEDALYVGESGQLMALTDFRKDLVVPIHGVNGG